MKRLCMFHHRILRLAQTILSSRITDYTDYRKSAIICVICGALFAACERRELTYPHETEITITADWSKAGLSEHEAQYGATAVFYPAEGGAPVTVLMGDRDRKTARLKKGRYHVVLFNRSFDDFGSIAFRGMEGHHTLEAYAKNAQNRGVDSGKVATDSPDELAAACVENFEVDGKSCRLDFTPRKLTREITATINIKGLNNIRTATCTLGGVSESVFVASGMPSERTMMQHFELGNPVYLPGSQTEGTLSATFSVFGFDESLTHDVQFKALLVDGKTEFSEELKDMKVNVKEDGEGLVHITIEVACKETVPSVRPEGSSGMDADVDGWDEEENKDIDI